MSEGPSAVENIADHWEYYTAFDAQMTITVSKPWVAPVIDREVPLFLQRKRWHGRLGVEFAFLDEAMLASIDCDLILVYRSDGFDDSQSPGSWDWAAEIYPGERVYFCYGEPYSDDWSFESVEVKDHV